MTKFSSLRARLVGTVFIAITPAWVVLYYTDLPWAGFAVGLMALGAAWFGGERFILRQVRVLLKSAERLAAGDLTSRSGLSSESGEMGELASKIDQMAENLQTRAFEREKAEKTLLTRSFQQTVVSALGQFALASNDLDALLDQVVMFVNQTLEVQYCGIFEHNKEQRVMRLRTGAGWKDGLVGTLETSADEKSPAGFILKAGEPVIFEDLRKEKRFVPDSFLMDHGVISGAAIVIPGQAITAFGVIGTFSTQERRFTEDEVHFLLAVATVIAMAVERAHSEARLQKLAAFTQLNPNPAMELADDGRLTYCNEAGRKLATAAGLEGPEGLFPMDIRDIVRNCLAGGHSKLRYETKVKGRTLSWSFHPVAPSRVVHAYVEDITDRLSLEDQLRHSQKLESVGQLAAGVAHDFNNMLTVIQGHSGMLLTRPGISTQARESAQAISFAAERATSLTRQLLMFSRKNVMQATTLDLRVVVSQLTKLLQRLLGETITLNFERPDALPWIQADSGMIEQVIMNLAVNARDAMPKGGILTISTSAKTVTADYVAVRPEARLGTFVCLRISDTGCGIDKTTMKRIFEPFFTTKEVGKGTGLGLATVYGIVKQHGGWIEVQSEPGKGSTFSVFMPATDKAAEPVAASQDTGFAVKGGKETVLVVEDESIIRDLAQTILEANGYRVLVAGSGPEALRIWNQSSQAVDLVLTDMVMPEGMSGIDLARHMHELRPSLKFIFASGYNLEDADTKFFPKYAVTCLQKPYTYVSLSRAVRESLDRQPAAAALALARSV